jgi:hypothetical protein
MSELNYMEIKTADQVYGNGKGMGGCGLEFECFIDMLLREMKSYRGGNDDMKTNRESGYGKTAYNGYELLGYSGGAPSTWILPLYAVGFATVQEFAYTMPHNTWSFGSPRWGNWITHKHTTYSPYSIYSYSQMASGWCDLIGAMFRSAGNHVTTVWKSDPIPHFPALCAGWLNLAPELWFNQHNNAMVLDWEDTTCDPWGGCMGGAHSDTGMTGSVFGTTSLGVSKGGGSEALIYSGPSMYADTDYNAFGQGLYMPMACGGFAAAAFVFMQGNLSHHNHYFGIENANYLFDEKTATGGHTSLSYSSLYGCEQHLAGGRQLRRGCNFGTGSGPASWSHYYAAGSSDLDYYY